MMLKLLQKEIVCFIVITIAAHATGAPVNDGKTIKPPFSEVSSLILLF